MILPSVVDPCYTWFYQELHDAAIARGYRVILSSVKGDSSEIEKAVLFMEANQVEGIICNVGVWGSVSIGHVLKRFIARNQPVILAGDCIEGLDADELVIENESGVRKATDYLIKTGRKKIGFLSGSLEDRANQERYRGFEAAMRANGIPINKAWQSEGHSVFSDGLAQAISVLGQEDKPDALVCAGDSLAICAIRAAKNFGLSVPEDLSILGFNDIEWAKLSVPSLTTLRQPQEIIARDALDLMLQRIEKGDVANPRRLVYEPELIVRESA